MAATDFVTPRETFGIADAVVKNTSGTDMVVGALVKLDTGNPQSSTQAAPGVVLTSAVGDVAYGVLAENIKNGQQGRCQVVDGTIAVCIAAGVIAVGATVGPSGATSGDVTTYTAANPSVGQALTAAASLGDPIRVILAKAKNA